jgi:hypothetical protein
MQKFTGTPEGATPDLPFYQSVIERKTDVALKTRKGLSTDLEKANAAGYLDPDRLLQPWVLIPVIFMENTVPAGKKYVDVIADLFSLLSGREATKLFGRFGMSLKLEYAAARQTIMDHEAAGKRAVQLGNLSPRHIKNWSKLEELNAVVAKKFVKGKLNLYRLQPFLWLAIALKQLIVRDNAHRWRVAGWDPDVDDYIDGKEKVLVFHDTGAGSPRKHVLPIADDLWSILEPYITRRLEKKVDYLFVNTKGNPFTASSFSSMVMDPLAKELDGRRVGVQMLKKIIRQEGHLSQETKDLIRDTASRELPHIAHLHLT